MARKHVPSSRIAVTAFVVVITAVASLIAAVAWSSNGGAAPPDDQAGCSTTAGAAQGWGEPRRSFNFDSPGELADWWLYDGPGHAGNGRRTPDAISVADGLVTITGDDVGNSGGMAPKGPGQLYGRWEACVKSPRSAPTYHSVLLLWPDAENWPVGGEIDFMEIEDPQRQKVDAYLHHGPDDLRQGGSVVIDASQWHTWAVEWTPQRIATFVDGVLFWETTDTANFPPGPMHFAMQLDDFGGDTVGGGQQIVDWVNEYSIA